MNRSGVWSVWTVPLSAAAVFLLGPAAALADPVNVARTGTATQSTIGWSMPAGLAIDGNLGTISHTDGSEAAPAVAWWEVDIGDARAIERIVVHNRQSACCQERLCNIVVSVLSADRDVVWHSDLLNPNNALGFSLTNIGGFDFDLIALTEAPVEGKIVRVERTHDTDDACGGYYLSLAEVEALVESSTLPVAIGTHPQSARRYVGQCQVFSVGLAYPENATSISYQWLKDDVEIPGATQSRLILGDIQVEDAGVYEVVVTADGDILTSNPATLIVPGLNLALYGTATQSSLAHGGLAERAIDGNTSGQWANASLSHTDDQAESWWQVELYGVSSVDRVVLWNRTDCCADRLSNFRLSALDDEGIEVVGQDFFTDVQTFPETPVNGFEIALPEPIECRTLKIQRLGPDRNGANFVSLAEFEVFGDGPLPPTDPLPNLARGCGTIATQSSEYGGGYPAARAIDGNPATFTHTGETDEDPTWQVDLGQMSEIAIVAVHSRVDCCQSRSRDITVSILDAAGDPVWVSDLLNPENRLGIFPSGPRRLWVDLRVLEGGPVMGQIVRIQRTPDPDLSGSDGQGNTGEPAVLSLSEVEVYGVPLWCTEEEGDTHLDSFAVDGPIGLPGVYTATASATDESGDEISYTFSADNGVDSRIEIGPQATGEAVFELLDPGAWSISVTVDDDEFCNDEADDATLSEETPIAIVGENLARAGTATQSTTNGAYTANLAIDGNLGNFTHTLGTDADPSWQVDLGVDANLYLVLLHNRDSCCGSRLRDITVTVLDAGGALVWESPLLNPENEMGEYPLGPAVLTVDLAGLNGGPVAGSVVRVSRTPDPDNSGGDPANPNADEQSVLSLGEVQVYGAVCPAEGDTHCTGLTVEATGASAGDAYDYLATATAVDDSGDAIIYTFTATADGMDPIIVGPQSGNTAVLALTVGTWTVTVAVDDDPYCDDVAEDPSCTTTVEVTQAGVGPFLRGNANADATLDLSDGVFIFNWLFTGGPEPPCLAAANTNLEATVSITSGIYVLNYLFTGGLEPPAPFPGCGVSSDPLDMALGCETPHTNCP